jgi:hypothetical protein
MLRLMRLGFVCVALACANGCGHRAAPKTLGDNGDAKGGAEASGSGGALGSGGRR